MVAWGISRPEVAACPATLKLTQRPPLAPVDIEIVE